LIESFFQSDGKLKPDAGKIDWPFGELAKSNSNCKIKEELQAKLARCLRIPRTSSTTLSSTLACTITRRRAHVIAKRRADRRYPPGFDYSGAGLHYAALKGHRAMVDFLIEQGANVNVKDTKVNSTPAGWPTMAAMPNSKTIWIGLPTHRAIRCILRVRHDQF